MPKTSPNHRREYVQAGVIAEFGEGSRSGWECEILYSLIHSQNLWRGRNNKWRELCLSLCYCLLFFCFQDEKKNKINYGNGIVSYQKKDSFLPRKEFKLDKVKFLRFLQQECGSTEDKDIEVDLIGYYVFFEGIERCRIRQQKNIYTTGSIALHRISQEKGYFIDAEYDFEYYTNIPKVREDLVWWRSRVSSQEGEEYKKLDESVNVEHVEFANNFVKLITSMDDPNLIKNLIKLNLNYKEVESGNRSDYIYTEKYINGYFIRVKRLYIHSLAEHPFYKADLSISISRE